MFVVKICPSVRIRVPQIIVNVDRVVETLAPSQTSICNNLKKIKKIAYSSFSALSVKHLALVFDSAAKQELLHQPLGVSRFMSIA